MTEFYRNKHSVQIAFFLNEKVKLVMEVIYKEKKNFSHFIILFYLKNLKLKQTCYNL